MDKNECKLNCSQAGSDRRQLLLSQVTCFIYKDMWATMLLSEREEKKSEKKKKKAWRRQWGAGGLLTLVSSEGSWECLNSSFKNVPAFKYANEQEADTWVDNSV